MVLFLPLSIHVRRTDKLEAEASLHDLSQYIEAANEYLMTRELKQNISGKRIYIASDDVTVLGEAKAK
jgi:glycoprotein 6-alpha-L-fucosyltransferase